MKANKGFKRLLTLAIMICMVLAMSLPALATGTQDAQGNTAVQQDKTGVLQVVTGVKDKETGKFIPVQAGTGFLVNNQNMVTCSHVANFNFSEDEIKKYITEELGLTEKQANERKIIQVSVYRDQVITATVLTKSDEADLAILKLEQPLQNRTYLKINTAEIQPTAPCYTLGFPGLVGAIIDKNTYTSDDVAVNFGMVNRLGSEGTVSSIVHTARMPSGGSGGPLVDYAGNVIGITQMSHSEDNTKVDYMTAIAVSELVNMMKPLAIEYTEVVDSGVPSTPVSEIDSNPDSESILELDSTLEKVDKSALQSAIDEAANPDTKGKKKELVDEFNDAIDGAKRINDKADATQHEVTEAASRLTKALKDLNNDTPSPGIPLPAIIAIIAAVIILVIVIILLKPRKKAEPPVYGPGPDLGGYPGGSTAGVPGGSGYEPAGGFDYVGKPEAGTTVLGGGAADTTVLSGDSNATTVLSGGGNFGTLTRTKTNERVTISREQFKIGRERSRVDYCINDNPAVGRLHAIILNRNGSTYVVDQNSTNCTFVNSVRASANQEVRLNNGDKVTFADEEFTYNAF